MSPAKTDDQKSSIDVWQLSEEKFEVEENLLRETLFSLGNGHLGLRGAHEERFRGFSNNTNDHTFINGFYESSLIHYTETAYGMAKEHQFMLNVPNGKCITFAADKENFDLFKGTINHYDRKFDFQKGSLLRQVDWTSEAGKQFVVKSKRVVSFTRPDMFALEYEIKSVNFTGVITLRSALDGRVEDEESGEPRYGPAVGAVQGVNLILLEKKQTEDFSALLHQTKRSKLSLASAQENSLYLGNAKLIEKDSVSSSESVEQVFKIEVKAGDTIRLTKFVCYITSRDYPEAELLDRAKSTLAAARKSGFAILCEEQESYLNEFWKRADIEIGGNDLVQQGLRFNQFHLLQSVGRDGHTSIAAKGLTGEGYGGHYFWDAESYALPFFLYSKPEIARKMLEYRYSCLGESRKRAREMSHPKGALFAWRTIGGEECSAYYPAGTAQYHIIADITYAIKHYFEATEDEEFLVKYGAEIVLDTARIWMDIGHYEPRKNNAFCIDMVTGPDEYTVLVDNNFYTNAMAQMHLKFAAELAKKLKASSPTDFERIKDIIELTDDEPEKWLKAAEKMYLPFDEQLAIHPQDDTFLSKKKWDLKATPPQLFPLPLHHHYLVIYRYQVCKQADTVLATFLLGDKFTMKEKKQDYDYYETITTHDSSLSHCTYSIMASEVGYLDKAYHYFTQSVRMDLDNVHGSSSYGVHIAAMGGTWMAVINGFAGMRAYGGKLQFAPYIPTAWDSYKFKLSFKGQLLEIAVGKEEVKYTLIEGDALTFNHHKIEVKLKGANASQTFPTKAQELASTASTKRKDNDA
jgi:alpha,alpha-trehalose phosphorylase